MLLKCLLNLGFRLRFSIRHKLSFLYIYVSFTSLLSPSCIPCISIYRLFYLSIRHSYLYIFNPSFFSFPALCNTKPLSSLPIPISLSILFFKTPPKYKPLLSPPIPPPYFLFPHSVPLPLPFIPLSILLSLYSFFSFIPLPSLQYHFSPPPIPKPSSHISSLLLPYPSSAFSTSLPLPLPFLPPSPSP